MFSLKKIGKKLTINDRVQRRLSQSHNISEQKGMAKRAMVMQISMRNIYAFKAF